MAKSQVKLNSQVKLEDAVAETALIPLVMKAREAQHPRSIWTDPDSVHMLQALSLNTEQYGKSPFSAIGVLLRAKHFDRAARQFIKANSGSQQPVIIQLGCGLDTRFRRIEANGKAIFYDLDLPEMIELRERLLPATGSQSYWATSMLDPAWMQEIQQRHPNQPKLILIEGVLMYFESETVKQFFSNLVQHFPNTEVLFDAIQPYMQKQGKRHDTVKQTRADFQWGVAEANELEGWDSRLQLLNRFYFFRDEPGRWPVVQLLARLIPQIGQSSFSLHYHIRPNK